MEVSPEPNGSVVPGRPKIGIGLIVLGLFLCCALPYGIYSSVSNFFRNVKDGVQGPLCLQNLRAVASAQAMYAVDNMGSLPGENWMDAIEPYLKENVGALGCPTVRKKSKDEYGFAMNSVAVGKSMASLTSLSDVPLVFDSTLLQRNAVGAVSTMPNPGRHRKDDSEPQFIKEENNVAFADGSARATEKRF